MTPQTRRLCLSRMLLACCCAWPAYLEAAPCPPDLGILPSVWPPSLARTGFTHPTRVYGPVLPASACPGPWVGGTGGPAPGFSGVLPAGRAAVRGRGAPGTPPAVSIPSGRAVPHHWASQGSWFQGKGVVPSIFGSPADHNPISPFLTQSDNMFRVKITHSRDKGDGNRGRQDSFAPESPTGLSQQSHFTHPLALMVDRPGQVLPWDRLQEAQPCKAVATFSSSHPRAQPGQNESRSACN